MRDDIKILRDKQEPKESRERTPEEVASRIMETMKDNSSAFLDMIAEDKEEMVHAINETDPTDAFVFWLKEMKKFKHWDDVSIKKLKEVVMLVQDVLKKIPVF